MSLINQMLQDLDARKAAHGAGSRLPNEVRPLPQSQASRWPLGAAVLLLLLLVSVVAAYFWVNRLSASLPAPAVVSPAPVSPSPISVAPPEATAVLVPAVAEPLPEVPAETLAAAPEPEPAESALHELGGSLRMADVMQLPAETKGARKPPDERRAPAPKPVQASASPAAAQPSSAVVAASPLAAGTKPPLIEKTETAGPPQEQAELEYRKAISTINQGRFDEALTGLRNALRHDAYHQAARQLLVKLLLESKRSDEAIQVLQEGLQTQPAQIAWAMSLARIQVDRSDLAGAWQTLNYSLPAAGNSADYQGFSGHVLQRLGRHKDAIERYLAAARLMPGDGRWWLGLGLSLEADGRASEAKEAFLRARQSTNLSAELMALAEQKLH